LDYVGGSAAADSLKFTNLANAQLAWRVDVEDQAQKAGKEVRRDVFHHVLHAADPETGKKFTREELQADSGLLIAAGSDGIAMTVSACIFYLLTNPETYEKLTAELRSAFKEAEEIRMPGVNKLPYLMACIQETLRISPALPASMPRLVLPGGLTIPSNNANRPPILIPAGTTVGVPAYAIHHNETYYPSSWTFRPERWIVSDTTSADQVALARKAFCPFSAGSMDCAGKNMAYLALKLALANLLWRYEVRLAEGKMTGGGGPEVKEEGRQRVGEYQMVDFIAAYRDGPIVELRERV
jgi:cytochrome P450